MVIAVYASSNAYQSSDAYEYWIKDFLLHLRTSYPQDDFYFINHRPIDGLEQKANFHLVYLAEDVGLISKYFSKRKLVSTIKKIKAQRLFSIDKIINTNIPQSVLITKSDVKKRFKINSFEKAISVFTLSKSLKEELVKQFKLSPETINVVYGGGSFRPSVSEKIKTELKEKYTEGKEYFLFRGKVKADENIITLLKAFSIFKKRQKSAMKLLLMGAESAEQNEIAKLLKTYKYRTDVVLANDKTEMLPAAAFAFIQPYTTNSLSFVFEACEYNVPVLADKQSPLIGIAPDAALYFDGTSADDMADKMMRVYKDENLYNRLQQNGNEMISTYSWETTIQLIGKSLQ